MVQASSGIKKCTGTAPLPHPRGYQQDPSIHTGASLWFLEPPPLGKAAHISPGNAQQPNPRVTRSHPGHMPSI